MKIGLLQVKGNCQEKKNFARLISRILHSIASGARVLVLPELFLHEYFPQTKSAGWSKQAHTLEKTEIKQLQRIAKKHNVVMVVPFFEQRGKGVRHNSCAVFNADGALMGVYRKMHIPDDPGFHEKYYFAPGDLGFKSFSTKYGRIGVLICWDQWFPEAARLTALKGCGIIVCPTAIGWASHELEKFSRKKRKELKDEELTAWKAVQRGGAIANGVFWAAVNRVGREGDWEFWGHSFVYGPLGQRLGELGPREERTLIVDCDTGMIECTRNTWTFFRDRREDAYKGLLNKFDS